MFRAIIKFLDPESVLALKYFRLFETNEINLPSELDGVEIDFISSRTMKGGSILEFGAGGSTLELCRLGFKVTSIETDKFWAKKINSAASGKLGLSPVVYSNIGMTGLYGYPSSSLKALQILLRRFRRYVNLAKSFECDTIVIDGRFRVAVFLTAALYFQNKQTLIVIDDYWNRPEYHVLEKIVQFDGKIGEMAFFYSKPLLNVDGAQRLLKIFLRDPR